ncbi:hypothetical protein [Arthrobacter sp. UYCo732]|uniref:hypothetical protein n=1 Tax=Arthrobacter sp. UYCo732 TaxID=3156336 RepID=UPI0033998229
MDVTKFIFRIIFKSVAFLALAAAAYSLYSNPEHELHGWYVGAIIWAILVAMDIGDDLQPESRAPWNRSS